MTTPDLYPNRQPNVQRLLNADGTAFIDDANPLPTKLISVGGAVTISADLVSADTAMLGTVSDATYTDATGAASGTLIALLKGVFGKLAAPLTAGGLNIRATGQIVKPADATQYSLNDHLANSLTAGSVTPMELQVARGTSGYAASGRLTGMRCIASTASGALTTTALDFDLLLFRKAANTPFAAGGYPADNSAIAITAAAMKECVGVFSFSSGGWRTAGLATGVAYQSVALNSARPYAPFNLSDLGTDKIVVVAVMAGVWAPTNVVHTFDFMPDVEAN